MMLPPLFAMSIYWHLPAMIVFISLVYSATRYDEWNEILIETARWVIRMVGFLGGIALVLYVMSLWI